MHALQMDLGSQERMHLLPPHRILARDDQRDTICSGTSLVGKAIGWKPAILKQSNNAQSISFVLPTLVGATTGGGDAFEVSFAVRGVDHMGREQEEVFSQSCPSKLGTSDPEAFAVYNTKTLWHWVDEIELLRHVTTGATINGFYVGHMVGRQHDPGSGSLYYDTDGVRFAMQPGIEEWQFDRVVAHNREAQTVSDLSSSLYSYSKSDGVLHLATTGAWDETVGLYPIVHPRARASTS